MELRSRNSLNRPQESSAPSGDQENEGQSQNPPRRKNSDDLTAKWALQRSVKLAGFLVILGGSLFFFVLQNVLLSGKSASFSRWTAFSLLPPLIVVPGYRKKSLSFSGALSALVVGGVLTLASGAFFACLLFFFVTCSAATKWKQKAKAKIEGADFKPGGQRNWIQVFCNGGVATFCALVYLMEVGCTELPLDHRNFYTATKLGSALLGSLACAAGDTMASEIGSAIGGENPRLITSFRRVPRGTNGAVSFVGLVASFAGGCIAGFGYWLGIWFLCDSAIYARAETPQSMIILLGGIGGLLGSLVDSLLGATLQYSGQDLSTGAIVEKPGPNVQKICGQPIFDNHLVNFLSGLITAILLPKITGYMF